MSRGRGAFGRVSRGTLIGAGFMLASGAVVALMEAVVRGLSQTLHPFVIVFWREMFSVALLLPFWGIAGRPLVRRDRLPLHFLRALLNGFAILVWYLALRSLPLAEATALGFTAILFAAMGSRVVLGETVSPLQWIAIAVGLGGAALIVGPHMQPGGGTLFGVVAALGSALLFAGSMLVAKLQMRGDGSAVSALLLALGMAALAGVLAAPVWAWPSPSDFGWLCLFALCNVLGQVFFLEAMRRAAAAVVIPLDISRLIWALVFGAAIYAEWPATPALIGAVFIAASTVMVVVGAHRTPELAASARSASA